MRVMQTFMVALVLVASAGAASAQDAQPQPARGIEPARVFPGDAIRLSIWNEPTLSGTWAVPLDGTVVFPKIGPLHVAGMEVQQVRDTLTSRFARYLREPAIDLEVQRKVQVLGAVRTPGVYTLSNTFTVSDALAMAGGVLPEGRQNRIELRRDNEVVQVLLGRTPLSDSPIRSGDQLFVPERSYVSRNAGSVAAVVSGTIGLLIALLAR